MAIDPKSKLVSFRVTEEDYDRVRELCLAQGLPSVSEMARTAIFSLLQKPSSAHGQSLEGRIAELEVRVRMLASDLRRLSGRTPVEVE